MPGPHARDLLERGAPADLRRRGRGAGEGPLAIPIRDYVLRQQVPSTNDHGGECFHAIRQGSQFNASVFARRFPAAHLTPALMEALKRRALVAWHAAEAIHELARHGGHVLVTSDLIEGLSLAELRAVLDARGARLPWPVALALASDACDRMGELRKADVPLPAVTPARLRLSLRGRLLACTSAPEIDDATPWHRRLAGVLLPILALAATAEERALLGRFAGDDDPGALSVLADALVERHPVLAPALPALVADDLATTRAPRALIEDSLDLAALRGFWALVIDAIEERDTS